MATSELPEPRNRVAVYLHHAPGVAYFHFRVGGRKFPLEMQVKFAGRDATAQLVTVRRVPSNIGVALAREYENRESNHLGHIRYSVKGSTAVVESYWPKTSAGRSKVPGLGYYLEAVCTNKLKNLGIKTVRTDEFAATIDRREQLQRAGLSTQRAWQPAPPIREWQEGLGRGIKRKIKPAG